MGARSWSERRRQAPPSQPPGPPPEPVGHFQSSSPPAAGNLIAGHHQQGPTGHPGLTSVLYAASSVRERRRLEAGALRDRQVRLASVQTDLLLDLPHPIALPEEDPCTLKLLRGGEEIYRGYIRPPPNRTIWEGGAVGRPPPPPPPPYAPLKNPPEYSDPPPCYSEVVHATASRDCAQHLHQHHRTVHRSDL